VRSAVAQGNYQIAFEVVKDGAKDAKSLPLVVTTQQAILTSPQARVAQVSEPGAKPLETAGAAPAAAPSSAPVPPVAPTPGAGRPAVGFGSTLSSLGEHLPQAPAQAIAAAPAPSRTAYFVASKVSDQGSLRGGPGATHPVVGSIGAGARYPVVQSVGASDDSWFKIRIDTGAEVWVAGSLGHVVEE
jgi:hypothetical protein